MVTRETSLFEGLAAIGIPAPDQVVRRLALLADLLENDAVHLGFLGPNEGQRVVSRHVLESAALVPHLVSDGTVIDVGSGAGLPGLVLAALGRDVVLIESQAKRARFLQRAAGELGLEADVRHARAEDEGRGDLRDSAGSVVARALAAPAVALELCLPLVRPGGRLLLPTTPDPASEPRGGDSTRAGSVESVQPQDIGERAPASEEAAPSMEASADDRRRSVRGEEGSADAARAGRAPAIPHDLAAVAELLGGGALRWAELSVPGADGRRWVMMVDKRRPTPDRFPRRPGVPKRRPLGGDVASVN